MGVAQYMINRKDMLDICLLCLLIFSSFLQVRDFASCFLFSLETQHTIGYGTRQTTTQCSDAMIVMSLQAVLGCLIQAFMVGLVFSKLSRPRNRSNTIIFSNQAVINLRNNQLCLVIRIGDLRDDNFILGTQISAKLLRRSTTAEGEMYQVKLVGTGCSLSRYGTD